MKVNFYHGYDGDANEASYFSCFFDNLSEPLLRPGAEPFKSCYSVEWSYHAYNLVDPRRSVVVPIVRLFEINNFDRISKWPVCDCLLILLRDFGLDVHQPSREEAIAFRTMFPAETADCLADSYMKLRGYAEIYADAMRVLNNPFFHKDPNANERRLVEIAEDNGLRFALDSIAVIPPPETLAREIALLNHGLRDPGNVEPVRARLAASIAETMSDWGLEPTVADDGGGAAPSPEQPRGTEP